MRPLICGLLAIVLVNAAWAQQVTPDPHDSHKAYVSIFTHADYAGRPNEAQLVRNIQSGPLLDFARSCHFKHYTTKDPIYQERFASMFPEATLPVICVQRFDGAYWYKNSGNRIPSDPGQLLEEIEFYRQLDPALDTNSKNQYDEPCGPDGCPLPISPNYSPADSLPDSAELFGGKTPIRDSLASMASTAFAIVALAFLVVIIIVALIILVVIRPRHD